MSTNSSIEWTEVTWNPSTGCDRVSPGCDNCYALTLAKRLKGMGSPKYQRDGDPRTSGPGFGVSVHDDSLTLPLGWRKPARIFVNSMSDLFHEAVSDEFVAEVFAVMAMAPQHTFQLLTKRHGRMRSLLASDRFATLVRNRVSKRSVYYRQPPLPLANVWLGVSVESQKWADIRVPALLETPASVRWLSCEPLLGPVDLTRFLCMRPVGEDLNWAPLSPAAAEACGISALHWVVAGGESGSGARPMHPDWARQLRDQCTAAAIPFFFKQHGEWFPIGPLYDQDEEGDSEEAHWDAVDIEVMDRKRVVELESTGHVAGGYQPGDPRTWLMGRLGKKAAGRVLDGRTWDEYPEQVSA